MRANWEMRLGCSTTWKLEDEPVERVLHTGVLDKVWSRLTVSQTTTAEWGRGSQLRCVACQVQVGHHVRFDHFKQWTANQRFNRGLILLAPLRNA